MLRLSRLKVPIKYDLDLLKEISANHLKIDTSEILDIKIARCATINKNINDVHFLIDVFIEIENENKYKYKKNVEITQNLDLPIKNATLSQRPVVIGSGPAGVFAALILAENGANPIILERGLKVDERSEKVKEFFTTGKLDEECNIQFGEGGAGTFSDGKLKAGKIDNIKWKILSEFYKAGAPSEILYLEKAHIGTDYLKKVVENLRKKIEKLGGTFIFSAKTSDILHENGQIIGVKYQKNGEIFTINTNNVILATGHSARDTLKMLYEKRVEMTQKPFGIGVRIEHPQEYINKLMYGNFAKDLPSADYHLVSHLGNSRNCYSFCMCPGGSVVAATSEKNSIVTNGMSNFNRDEKNANSALLVTVFPSDFDSEHPLAGFDFQRKIEEKTFNISGDYKAPCQRLEDFMNDENSSHFGNVTPSYSLGTVFAKTDDYLPNFITDTLRLAIKDMDSWLKGYYYKDAILTGSETRSTSPVRIVRDDNLQCPNINGLYPCGEGAGYSGGIVSSAYDGILCSMKILE